MKKGLSIWDILAWIVLGLIVLWLILKVTGIINTPDLVTYAPYFGAVYLAGWAMHKLESISTDVVDLKRFRKETVNQIHDIKINCARNHHGY